MGTPITEEDLELMRNINIKNIIKFYKYSAIIFGMGYI